MGATRRRRRLDKEENREEDTEEEEEEEEEGVDDGGDPGEILWSTSPHWPPWSSEGPSLHTRTRAAASRELRASGGAPWPPPRVYRHEGLAAPPVSGRTVAPWEGGAAVGGDGELTAEFTVSYDALVSGYYNY